MNTVASRWETLCSLTYLSSSGLLLTYTQAALQLNIARPCT